MGDEPTPGEVSRAFAELRQDNRDEHERLRRGLTHKVDRQVYEADMRRWDDRYAQLRDDMRRQAEDHETERKAFQDWRDKRDQARKWIIASLILPIGGIVVEIISLLGGIHK